MTKPPRITIGGIQYHVMNRAAASQILYASNDEYFAFEQLLAEAKGKFHVRLLAYSLMPNHFHLVLFPTRDRELSEFMKWLLLTHTRRRHLLHRSVGRGHLYQGRFHSVPIFDDRQLYATLRYVERNPLDARLAARAELWRWGSAWLRQNRRHPSCALLDPWPFPVPGNWLELLNHGIQSQFPGAETLDLTVT